MNTTKRDPNHYNHGVDQWPDGWPGSAIEEIESGDYWMERSKDYLDNGGCPVCFATDEAGHTNDCAWGQAEAEVARLKDLCAEAFRKRGRWCDDYQYGINPACDKCLTCRLREAGGIDQEGEGC